jgi:hypothetical protein
MRSQSAHSASFRLFVICSFSPPARLPITGNDRSTVAYTAAPSELSAGP